MAAISRDVHWGSGVGEVKQNVENLWNKVSDLSIEFPT